MAYFFLAKRRRRRNAPVTVVQIVGPRTLDGIVAAAATMAWADGRAEPVEHRGLIEFVRRHNLLGLIGRRTLLARFANDAEPDRAEAAHRLLERLRPLAGTSGARLVEAAATVVAVADGNLDPDEASLLQTLRTRLGLTSETLPAAP